MITIYGKPGCPYCVKAKELLDDLEIEYEYWDVDDLRGARELLKAEGFTTVPGIFDGMEKIGGFTELEKLYG